MMDGSKKQKIEDLERVHKQYLEGMDKAAAMIPPEDEQRTTAAAAFSPEDSEDKAQAVQRELVIIEGIMRSVNELEKFIQQVDASGLSLEELPEEIRKDWEEAKALFDEMQGIGFLHILTPEEARARDQERETLERLRNAAQDAEKDRPEYSPEDLDSVTKFSNWNNRRIVRLQDLDAELKKALEIFRNDNGSEPPELEHIVKETAEKLDSAKAEGREAWDKYAKFEKRQERDQRRQAEIEKQISEPGFVNIPTSPATNLMLDFLIFGADAEELQARQQLTSHGEKLKVEKKGKITKITQETRESRIVIEAGNVDKITGNNGAARKMFTLIMQKANEQAIYNGKLTREYIVFPLHELVDRGIFKTIRGARQGFDEAIKKLQELSIVIKTTKRGEKVKIEDKYHDGIGPLFTFAKIEDAQCYVFLNDKISCWKDLTKFYTMIPSYYYSLKDRPADLLYYIFYLARQNAGKIGKNGYFTISYRAIQSRLKLPSETGAANPKRDIKDVIDKAIEDIEEKNRKEHYKGIDLLPVVDDEARISEYLNKGYLKVTLSGDLGQKFTDIYNTADKKRKTAEKRKAQIEDRAKAVALEKKIEASGGNDHTEKKQSNFEPAEKVTLHVAKDAAQ